jgi:hypothetical protein
MEKQNKILLGIGAVIAAYLILKPKKVSPSVSNTISEITKELKNKVAPVNGVCPSGYIEETIYCITAPCPQGMCRPATAKEIEEEKRANQLSEVKSRLIPYNNNPWGGEQPKGPCVCDQAPCNC